MAWGCSNVYQVLPAYILLFQNPAIKEVSRSCCFLLLLLLLFEFLLLLAQLA